MISKIKKFILFYGFPIIFGFFLIFNFFVFIDVEANTNSNTNTSTNDPYSIAENEKKQATASKKKLENELKTLIKELLLF